jgi:CRISPR-associated protein Cas2
MIRDIHPLTHPTGGRHSPSGSRNTPSRPCQAPIPVQTGRIPLGWWENAFTNRPTPSEQRGHPCGENQMLTVVAYDITDQRRLQRIAKICEDYGLRVQYSVFECRLEADKFDKFWNDLLATSSTDRLVAYKVCVSCARDIRSAGTETHEETVVAYVFCRDGFRAAASPAKKSRSADRSQ